MARKKKSIVKPKQDGSLEHVLRGGPNDGMKVRLYESNGGFEKLTLGDATYVAPPEFEPTMPYMIYQEPDDVPTS